MAMGPFLTNRSECPTHNSPPAMRRTPSICPQRKEICMSHIGHFNVCAEILDHQTRHLHLPTCICSCACLWWPHFFFFILAKVWEIEVGSLLFTFFVCPSSLPLYLRRCAPRSLRTSVSKNKRCNVLFIWPTTQTGLISLCLFFGPPEPKDMFRYFRIAFNSFDTTPWSSLPREAAFNASSHSARTLRLRLSRTICQ